jgi:hypothetical protein
MAHSPIGLFASAVRGPSAGHDGGNWLARRRRTLLVNRYGIDPVAAIRWGNCHPGS